jgi:hypothetical protein
MPTAHLTNDSGGKIMANAAAAAKANDSSGNVMENAAAAA